MVTFREKLPTPGEKIMVAIQQIGKKSNLWLLGTFLQSKKDRRRLYLRMGDKKSSVIRQIHPDVHWRAIKTS